MRIESLDRLLSVSFPTDTSYFVIAERGTLIGGILWEGTRFDGRKLISYDDWLDVLKCRSVLSIEEFTSHKVTMRNILKCVVADFNADHTGQKTGFAQSAGNGF